MKKRIKSLKLLFVAVLLVFLILEIILRITGVKIIYPKKCRQYDSFTYLSFVPNSVCRYKTTEWDITYKINSLGLRDNQYSREKPTNTYRILMLGDSFIEGFGVPIEETFPKLVEKALNENSTQKVEILTYGVATLSTLPEYFFLLKEGINLQPDLVILNFNMTDFIDEYYYYNQLTETGKSLLSEDLSTPGKKIDKETQVFSFPPPPQVNPHDYILRIKLFLDENSVIYNKSIRLIKSLINRDSLTKDVGDWQKDMFALTRPELPQKYEEAFEKPKTSILKIKKLLDSHKIDFMITLIPHGHMVNDREWAKGRKVWALENGITYSDRALIDLENWAKKEGIDSFNLTPPLKLASQNRRLFFEFDGHFNKEGHYVTAQAFLVRLVY